jgi:hypothetical protein
MSDNVSQPITLLNSSQQLNSHSHRTSIGEIDTTELLFDRDNPLTYLWQQYDQEPQPYRNIYGFKYLWPQRINARLTTKNKVYGRTGKKLNGKALALAVSANEEMTSEGRIGIQRQRAEKVRKQGKNQECRKRAESRQAELEAEG